jgi:hypothetical protein
VTAAAINLLRYNVEDARFEPVCASLCQYMPDLRGAHVIVAGSRLCAKGTSTGFAVERKLLDGISAIHPARRAAFHCESLPILSTAQARIMEIDVGDVRMYGCLSTRY